MSVYRADTFRSQVFSTSQRFDPTEPRGDFRATFAPRIRGPSELFPRNQSWHLSVPAALLPFSPTHGRHSPRVRHPWSRYGCLFFEACSRLDGAVNWHGLQQRDLSLAARTPSGWNQRSHEPAPCTCRRALKARTREPASSQLGFRLQLQSLAPAAHPYCAHAVRRWPSRCSPGLSSSPRIARERVGPQPSPHVLYRTVSLFPVCPTRHFRVSNAFTWGGVTVARPP